MVGKVRDNGKPYPVERADFEDYVPCEQVRKIKKKLLSMSDRLCRVLVASRIFYIRPRTSSHSHSPSIQFEFLCHHSSTTTPVQLIPSDQTSKMVKATSAVFTALSALSLAYAAEYTVSTTYSSTTKKAAVYSYW